MGFLLKTAHLFNYAHCSQMFYFSFIIIFINIIIAVTIWSCLRIRGYHPNSQTTISRGRMISYSINGFLKQLPFFSIKTIFLNSSDLVNTQRFGSVGSLVSPVATRLSQARVILLPGIANRPGCIVHTSLTMTGVANC